MKCFCVVDVDILITEIKNSEEKLIRWEILIRIYNRFFFGKKTFAEHQILVNYKVPKCSKVKFWQK